MLITEELFLVSPFKVPEKFNDFLEISGRINWLISKVSICAFNDGMMESIKKIITEYILMSWNDLAKKTGQLGFEINTDCFLGTIKKIDILNLVNN